jgi:hypothetical protein
MTNDLTLSPRQTYLFIIPLTIFLIVGMLALFVLVWGVENTFNLEWFFGRSLNLLAVLAVIFLAIVLHEFLHGLGWLVFGRLPLNAVRFGIFWKVLTPYAHLKAPIDIRAYRIGGFLPGLVMGILPYLVGLFTGSNLWLWFGILMTTAAAGDLLVLWLIRKLPRGTMVQDHPSRVGCTVIDPGQDS